MQTPNDRRLVEMTKIIERFKPDAVVDVILQACHSYNIESFKVGEHIQEKHGLSFQNCDRLFSKRCRSNKNKGGSTTGDM